MSVIMNLIALYSWQVVVVSILTLCLVELSKPVARKLIKEARVRHVLYIVLSYAVALGLSAGLVYMCKRQEDMWAVFGAVMVVINVLCPVLSSSGAFDFIEDFVRKRTLKSKDGKYFKSTLKALGADLGIDYRILGTILEKVESEYIEFLEKDANDFFKTNGDELAMNLKQKLVGFVSNERLQEATQRVYEKFANVWDVDISEI